MDIAKIIYVSLTMLTAWVFMSIAFPIDTYKHLLGVVGSYICVSCSALFASWFAWHWVHPFSYVKYLLCGLLTAFLFHAGLTIGCSIPIIFLSCCGVLSIKLNNIITVISETIIENIIFFKFISPFYYTFL